MSPKFQVFKDASGKMRFRLKADNGQIVAVGEAYQQYRGCLNGIRSVRKNSGSPTEDLTVEGGPRFPNPKYQIFEDASGKFRFHLKAGNGEIIAQGEGYESKESCFKGIDVVRTSASAEIEDSFAKKPSPELIVPPKTEVTPEPQPLMIEPQTPLAETKPITPLAEIKHGSPIPVAATPVGQPSLQVPPIPPTTPAETPTVNVGPADTTLELFPAPANIAKGSKVALKGRLYASKSGRGIPGAKIQIYELDTSILGDDYLAYGTTGEDGVFNVDWHARSLTWRKKTGDIYAKFNGNEKARPSKSAVQEITFL
jgi:uncharacterized protein